MAKIYGRLAIFGAYANQKPLCASNGIRNFFIILYGLPDGFFSPLSVLMLIFAPFFMPNLVAVLVAVLFW
ncbi:hypothetical protein [Moraxella caprae]|uniref:hypothetical protein n=1 Tax=Moraxella caprae TaxID=90240 RepID=UPI0004901922|nr:hypothetical protein [Moraxella caprae]